MRVLLTTDTVGGVWTYTQELSLGLLEHGSSVALVSFGFPPSSEQIAWTSSVETQFPANFFYIPTSLPLEWMEDNHASFMEGSTVLETVAQTFQPDLLHSNQFCFGAVRLRLPRVVVAHSDVLTWAEACKPGGLEQTSWLRHYVSLVQRGLDFADAVVAPTYWMLNALAAHFTLPAERSVIANGRSLRHSNAAHIRLTQAVSAGRMWDPAKGLTNLQSVSDSLPIVIAGSTSEGEHPESQSSGVTLTGRLTEEDLFALFHRSSVYIAASIYEPFGLAPLEAALCGCALVVNNIPSFREVWGDGALYFEDTLELKHLLRRLAENADYLQERQSVAGTRAKSLTSELMTTRYLELYDNVLTYSQHKYAAGSTTYVG